MKNKILFVLCILFGLVFVNAGLNKFLEYMPVPELSPDIQAIFDAFMTIGWILPLVGAVEIIGGVLIMVPQTRALGAIVIFPVMVSIVLLHALQDQDNLPMALVLLAINLWVLFENIPKYKPMVEA